MSAKESKKIPSFVIFLNAANRLCIMLGEGSLPAGARLMYCESIEDGGVFMNGFKRSWGNGRLGYHIDNTRLKACDKDARWFVAEAEERMDDAEEAQQAGDFDTAVYEYELARDAAQRSTTATRLYVEASLALGELFADDNDHASAVEYLEDALEVAEEYHDNNKRLCNRIRDQYHQSQARAVAPDLFFLFEDVIDLSQSDSADDWCKAEEVAEEVVTLATKHFGDQHWTVAAGLRELADFKDDEEAVPLLKRAAAIASEWGPPEDTLRKSISKALRSLTRDG